MVQMETLIEELWTPIARYDTHHGFAHLDLLRLDGTADKIPIVARDFNLFGSIPRSLLRNGDSKSSQGLSFPHAFSGNPGETWTGPPIKTFGGDNFGKNYHKVFRYPAACCGVVH
jgi:hypothetical protein